ncbi:hypothetical protein [Cohnella massiliensis]|uniref:hypothetical protein n=1 Tax=Cohnella massiliensis TaxID=1816691 RepID=UPI0009BAA2C0|nr:hypothetical protein [Cohnella massiliensis]
MAIRMTDQQKLYAEMLIRVLGFQDDMVDLFFNEGTVISNVYHELCQPTVSEENQVIKDLEKQDFITVHVLRKLTMTDEVEFREVSFYIGFHLGDVPADFTISNQEKDDVIYLSNFLLGPGVVGREDLLQFVQKANEVCIGKGIPARKEPVVGELLFIKAYVVEKPANKGYFKNVAIGRRAGTDSSTKSNLDVALLSSEFHLTEINIFDIGYLALEEATVPHEIVDSLRRLPTSPCGSDLFIEAEGLSEKILPSLDYDSIWAHLNSDFSVKNMSIVVRSILNQNIDIDEVPDAQAKGAKRLSDPVLILREGDGEDITKRFLVLSYEVDTLNYREINRVVYGICGEYEDIFYTDIAPFYSDMEGKHTIYLSIFIHTSNGDWGLSWVELVLLGSEKGATIKADFYQDEVHHLFSRYLLESWREESSLRLLEGYIKRMFSIKFSRHEE